jgi:haloacid dehalogenase superfamily, subfamily IA, variant 1 with third motif having Dx(3-4)D or Dx(3-4)E
MKRLSDYQAIIVDMDGTLYYQKPVRLAIFKEMLLRFWRLPDFLLVKKYRQLYEQGYDEKERLSRLPERASQVIREWLVERPLPFVCKYKDTELIDLLVGIAIQEIPVIVYSDYPVKEKLSAMGFSPQLCYTADELGKMKPEASKLIDILLMQGINPKKCLVIGDRYEKDGKLAENMGADYLLLPRERAMRTRFYQSKVPV